MFRTSSWMLGPVLFALLACKGQRGETTSATAESNSPALGLPAPAPGSDPASSGKIRIINSRGYVSESGFVVILGEVVNDTGSWIDTIGVDVTLLDASGKPLNVDSIAAADGHSEGVVPERSVLAPGERSPFKYLRDVKKLSGTYEYHELAAHARAAKHEEKISVTNVASSREATGWWKASGTLTNAGDRPCRFPQAVIAFYSADGKLYDVSSAVPKDDKNALVPGEAWSFDRPAALEDESAAAKEVKVWGTCAQD
jgi:hypothetical protein